MDLGIFGFDMGATNEQLVTTVASSEGTGAFAETNRPSALLQALLGRNDEQIPDILCAADGIGPLEAALLDDAETLARHVAQGVDPLCSSEDGWSTLHLAAWAGSPSVISTLIKWGVWVDRPGGPSRRMTALSLAVSAGHATVTRQLLEAGADPDVADGAGWTPLHMAAHLGDLHVVKLLLLAGADIHALCGDCTPLEIAIRERHRPLIALLRQVGASD